MNMTQTTDPDGITGILCNWIHDFDIASAPDNAVSRAKAIILDGITCALYGARLPWSITATEIIRKFESPGSGMVVGTGLTTSIPGSVVLNGTFIQGFELDDYHPLAPLHSASLVLPSLWGALDYSNKKYTGKKFLEAALVGFEVGPRVGMALHGGQMLSRGWHSGSVFGTHAAAAAASKLLELKPNEIEDALGLAGTQSAGLMAAQYEAMCKRMHHGFSARNGLYSVVLAQGGYTGIKKVFERDYGGFLSTFGEGHDPDETKVIENLGTQWEVEKIVVKHYAAMGGIHSTLDAFFDMNSEYQIEESEVKAVEVQVSHSTYKHGWWKPERPLTTIGAQMNIGYALAAAIVDKMVSVDQFQAGKINSDKIWSVLNRINVLHNPEFDKGGQKGRGRVKLKVELKNGQILTKERVASKAILYPSNYEKVAEKFYQITSNVIDKARQEQIENFIRTIEVQENIQVLNELLFPEVSPP